MLTFTQLAKEQILAAIEDEEGEDLALRVVIEGRGPGGFRYSLDVVGPHQRKVDDIELDLEDFKVYVDKNSAPNLEGTTIDFLRRLEESGFKFDNPNSLWSDPRATAVQEVIDNQINPAVAAHGGSVALLEVKGDVVYIALGGGCQGCGMADVTLKQGIEVAIKEAVPEITQILDTTDHAAGNNPYYEPSKGGDSPFV